MSGAILATFGPGGGVGGGAAPVITPNPALLWSDVSGSLVAATQALSVLAITVPISITMTKTGGGTVYYNRNGGSTLYTGAVTVNAGDTLGWSIFGAGAGTVTVRNQTNAGAVLATFTYVISGIYF